MDAVSKAQSVANNEKTTPKRLGGITGKGFQPGKSGNPSGRPKKNHITKIYEKILANPATRKEIQESFKKVLTSGRMATVLMAREMAERTEGKIAQTIEVDGTLTISLAETIQQRRKKLRGTDNES